LAQKCSNHRRQPYQVLMLRGEDQLGCELTIERPEQILHPCGIHRRCVVLAVCGKNTWEWRPKELAIVLFQTAPQAKVEGQVFGELYQDMGDCLPLLLRQM